MPRNNRYRSIPAVLMGVACTIGTLIVLFGHIRHLDDLTLNHLYILTSLIVAFGAGHYMLETTGFRRASFIALFLIATLICVGLSGARSASSYQSRIDDHASAVARAEILKRQIDDIASQRASRTKELDTVNARLRTMRADIESECSTGAGKKCDGRKSSLLVEQHAADDIALSLAALNTQYWAKQEELIKATPTPSNPELRHLSRMIGTVFNASEERVLATLLLVLPYALSLITEFGGITLINFGLSRAPVTVAPPATDDPLISLSDIALSLNIDARIARKRVRELGLQKPPHGWSWSKTDAEIIRERLSNSTQ